CSDGPPQTVTVTVEPTPQATIVTTTPVICNGGNVNVTINSPTVTTIPANLSYVVTVTSTDPAHLGGTASVGFTKLKADLPFTITGTLTNSSDNPIVVTYTVTPKLNGCSDGPPQSVTVTVEPTPQVTIVTTTPIICNGSNVNVTINSPTVTTTSANLSYVVTVTSTDPAHLEGTASSGFTKLKADLPFTITGTLTNSSDNPIVVTYTVTPKLNGCSDGPPHFITVTVNPTPQVFPSTTGYTICNNGTTSIILTSPSTFTSGVITFNYTVIATGGVTGFTTPVNGLPNNWVISDILHNPTDTSQTVTYTIIPISPTGCVAGPSKTVIITVDPTLQVVPSTLSQTICNDGITNVTLYSPTIFSSGVITFNYTVVATGGVTGFTTPVAGLPNNSVISDVLHNPTDTYQTVTYRITPISPRCSTSDPDKIVVITVNPTPRIYPIPSNTIQCDSLTTNIQLQSPSLFTSGLITFKYTVTTTGLVTGYSTPVSGLKNNQIVGDKLINNTDHFQTVTYTVVPVSPTGCLDGPAKDITVTVNPTPRVVPNNNFPGICYVGTPQAPVNTQIVLTSPSVMTSGSIRFDYTVGVTGGPGVVVGNTAPAVDLPLSYTINFTYQNNSDTIQSVYYTITPKVDNAICVPGKKAISEVKIHARPLQSIVVTKPLTCSGGAGLAALRAVISKGANPYQVVWDGPVGYHKVDSLAIANLSSGKYVIKVTDNLGCNRKDSISIVPVTARAYISADVILPGNYNISCIGSTDGRILVSVTGGITPPYNYWVVKNDVDTLYSGLFTNNLILSDPTTYRYYNNLGAGSYTLVIQDVNGCINLNRIVFRVPPIMVSVFTKSQYAGGYNISCKGYNDGYASVQTSGGRGGYTYRWYTYNGNIPGPINTNRIDNLIAGTYFLETKDVLSCVKIDSTVVTEPDGMQLSGYQLSKSADGNFNISCNGGNDGSIAMTISGGSGSYIYSWIGPSGFTASTNDLTGLKAGMYTCSVKDQNGCVLTPSPSFTLTEPTVLVLGPPVTSISTDGAYNINCYGANSGWINITVSGGSVGAYKYNWSTSDGSGIINGQKDQPSLTAGTYHLVVTDSNICVITKDITLIQPPALVTELFATNITCESPGFNNGSINLTVTGGVPPYSFLWSNGAMTKNLAALTAGNYTVTITDFNGCIKKDSAKVDLPPALEYTKNLSDYNGFNISCNGLTNGFIHVDPTTGSPPFVYTWTGPNGFTATSKNILDLAAGQYQLLIVDSNECKASEIFDLTEPGKLGFTSTLSSSIAGGFNINCAGESTGSIDIEPANQVKTVDYLWADGIFGKTRTNLPAGNYSLIITDANNCHASSTITITEPDSMKLVFNILPPFCPDKPDGSIGTNVTGGVKGAGYSYKWSDNSTNSNLINIPEGYYKVTVTDMDGCSVKDSVNVKPINETCLIIPNAISPNGDLINDVWNIGMKELYPKMEVIIFNRWGETLWRSERGYPRPWDGTSNGSSLPIDSYHYIIDLHNGSRPLVGNVTIVR
ncbi:MAG: PKD-like domain-containing protein, partial [Bacteroidales bacterium]